MRFIFSPKCSLFLVINLKFAVAGLEGVNLLGAHWLVLVKLAEALDDAHHLVHAGLLSTLGGCVAHQVLQTEGKSLDEGNIFILNALPAIAATCQQVLRLLVEGGADTEPGSPGQVHHGATRPALKWGQSSGCSASSQQIKEITEDQKYYKILNKISVKCGQQLNHYPSRQ